MEKIKRPPLWLITLVAIGIIGLVLIPVFRTEFVHQAVTTIQATTPPSNDSPTGFSNTTEGFKWIEDKNAKPFDEVIAKVPFQVKQPQIPFEVTNKAANAIKAPTKPAYDVIEMTYANAQQGLQLTLGEANSNDSPTPKGEMGPKLQNGSQTWIAGDQNKSGLYWRYDGINYSLISFKIDNGKFVPLYDHTKLVEIANTIGHSTSPG